MNIYRLGPIDQNHPAWQNSDEQECVWASAPTPKAARDLVANKTSRGVLSETGIKSPWQDEAVTSCVLEPSVTHIRAGAVVRTDGSSVSD